MPIITLTTDWGDIDHYKGAAKGLILQHLPNAQIIDISHSITPFDFIHAARVLKNAYPYFPEGTVHVIAVDTDAELNQPHCIVQYNNHFFIGKDNGIFSLIFDNPPQQIVHIDWMQDTDCLTFPAKNIFCKIAVELLKGKEILSFGNPVNEIKQVTTFKPIVSENEIIGRVLYVDYYHNLITNIDKTLFTQHRKNRKFSILFHDSKFEIKKISTMYNNSLEAGILAIFGENGLLEIALNKSKADELLGMKEGANIIIRFYD